VSSKLTIISRGAIDMKGVSQLLDKLSSIISTASKQVILKTLDSEGQSQVTLSQFIDVWRSS
jgi:Ca2+-binding EF-hand superfamily protein